MKAMAFRTYTQRLFQKSLTQQQISDTAVALQSCRISVIARIAKISARIKACLPPQQMMYKNYLKWERHCFVLKMDGLDL